ncbi:hypothetical protein DPMN_161320 [Dreissena polymorpha]|uniref:Uncharacterized protein n=1 Tax=Dreissena polymorpha TaxID=45954 RepID=A0A9D4EPH3_DREPO|nr:hypothetical protein DPMN_161320 [Dreissena polymorpha]
MHCSLYRTYQTEYVSESDETRQTCLPQWAKHAPSSSARLGAAVSGESVAEGSLTDPYWLRYHIIGALCRTYHTEYASKSDETWQTNASKSDETWQTYVSQWAMYALSSSARLGAAVTGESVDESTLTG